MTPEDRATIRNDSPESGVHHPDCKWVCKGTVNSAANPVLCRDATHSDPWFFHPECKPCQSRGNAR